MKTIEIPIDDNFKSVYHYDDDGTLIDHAIETKKGAATANEETCVSRKLKIIAKENPDMAVDQQLAIAYSYCQKEGLAALADDLKNKRDITIIS